MFNCKIKCIINMEVLYNEYIQLNNTLNELFEKKYSNNGKYIMYVYNGYFDPIFTMSKSEFTSFVLVDTKSQQTTIHSDITFHDIVQFLELTPQDIINLKTDVKYLWDQEQILKKQLINYHGFKISYERKLFILYSCMNNYNMNEEVDPQTTPCLNMYCVESFTKWQSKVHIQIKIPTSSSQQDKDVDFDCSKHIQIVFSEKMDEPPHYHLNYRGASIYTNTIPDIQLLFESTGVGKLSRSNVIFHHIDPKEQEEFFNFMQI